MSTPLRRVPLSESVAGEVRAHLARARLSGRQAALQLGWTQPYMSRRLTGDIPFDVADLEAIADLLGIPVATLFDQGPNDGNWGLSPQVSARSALTRKCTPVHSELLTVLCAA
jgi:transcriptional regulator with XRE-family HTH domain